MKRFLKRIVLFIGVPLVVLLAVYLVTDPYKTLRPFSLDYFVETNREYISTELFLRNDPKYHYNSFVFGSSRCCGINTYHWKHYLPEGARPYLFQAWGETLTGIAQKINYLDRNGNAIDHAMVLLDVPSSLGPEQLPKTVLSIKNYRFSGQPRWAYQARSFYGFVQKPSQWISAIGNFVDPPVNVAFFDTITNDWDANNREADLSRQPEKPCLKDCSPKVKSVFFKQIEGKTDADLRESEPLINEVLLTLLKQIKSVFDKHHTDYRIVITPAYCYANPSLNRGDRRILEDLFGVDRVYDYSGKNDLTVDYDNFSDPNHFGLCVGWQIIEDIYNSK